MSHAGTSVGVCGDTHRVTKPTPDNFYSARFPVPFLHTILSEFSDRTFVLLELSGDTNHREAEFVSDRRIEIEVIVFVRECRFLDIRRVRTVSIFPNEPLPSGAPVPSVSVGAHACR